MADWRPPASTFRPRNGIPCTRTGACAASLPAQLWCNQRRISNTPPNPLCPLSPISLTSDANPICESPVCKTDPLHMSPVMQPPCEADHAADTVPTELSSLLDSLDDELPCTCTIATSSPKSKDRSAKESPAAIIPGHGCPVELHVLNDKMASERVYPFSAAQPIAFETPFFQGHVLSRLRTPGDLYFEGCDYQFEIQIQGQFQQPMDGTLWFGVELPCALNLSWFKQRIATLCLEFVTTWAHGLTWSLGDSDVEGDCARLSVPLLTGIHRIVPTPPGEPPPPLGQRLPWTTAEAQLKRQNSDGSTFLAGHTYTMALYTIFVDLNNWALINVPGLRTLSLDSICSSFRLVVYAASSDPKSHLAANRSPIWQLLVHRPPPTLTKSPAKDS